MGMQEDKAAQSFLESLQGFQTLMAALTQKIQTVVRKSDDNERDIMALMEKQIEQEERIQKLERAAGFRTPLWKRLLGKKSHLDYPPVHIAPVQDNGQPGMMTGGQP